jgi:hypothetical protein
MARNQPHVNPKLARADQSRDRPAVRHHLRMEPIHNPRVGDLSPARDPSADRALSHRSRTAPGLPGSELASIAPVTSRRDSTAERPGRTSVEGQWPRVEEGAGPIAAIGDGRWARGGRLFEAGSCRSGWKPKAPGASGRTAAPRPRRASGICPLTRSLVTVSGRAGWASLWCAVAWSRPKGHWAGRAWRAYAYL